VAFIDLEGFKGHKYPDVLISVLIETMHAFDKWLITAGLTPANKSSFWHRVFGAKPERPPLDKKKVIALRERVASQIADLDRLLHSEDNAELTSRVQASHSVTAESETADKLEIAAPVRIGIEDTSRHGSRLEAARETTESGRRNKIDFLHRHIIDFQKLFEEIVDASASDAYIFLDDLYHIARSDQANVLDYFHRIVKGRSVWLKVGTIRHRTDWYRHGDPPVGIKLGDDCDDIDLDITLEKYELARTFLVQVLDQLIHEADLKGHAQLLAPTGTERLVLASGGVARDFLTIFVDRSTLRGSAALLIAVI
jgi:hypothetical protein